MAKVLITVMAIAIVVIGVAADLNDIDQDCDCDCDYKNATIDSTWGQFQKKHIAPTVGTPTTRVMWNALLRERCPRDYNRPNGRTVNTFVVGSIPDIQESIRLSISQYTDSCNNSPTDRCFWSTTRFRVYQMYKNLASYPTENFYDVYQCDPKYFIGRKDTNGYPNHMEGFATVTTALKELESFIKAWCTKL